MQNLGGGSGHEKINNQPIVAIVIYIKANIMSYMPIAQPISFVSTIFFFFFFLLSQAKLMHQMPKQLP